MDSNLIYEVLRAVSTFRLKQDTMVLVKLTYRRQIEDAVKF